MAYRSNSDQDPVRSQLAAGLEWHRQGRVEQAAAAYRCALAIAPDDADALNLLGAALLQLGHAAEAAGHLERAVRQSRNNAAFLGNLGQAYLALHKHAEAGGAFRKAARLQPAEQSHPLGLAAALACAGRLDEAETLLRRLAPRFPQSALIWLNLGHVERDRGRHAAALEAYDHALCLDASLIDAHNARGSALHSTLRFTEAETGYRACIALDPRFVSARYNLASVLIDVGRFAEAEQACRELLALAPAMPEAHMILAAALGHQGRLLEARASCEQAAQLAPDSARHVGAYAASLLETGDTAEGLRWAARAIALDPQAIAFRQLLGTALLAAGQWEDGWRDYRHRPAALRLREKHRHLGVTDSLPHDLAGKHVCVLREQGLGDEIFFLRYAPLLAACGARVTCRVSDKIVDVLSTAQWSAAVVAESTPATRADVFILAGDLPHALGALAQSASAGSSPGDFGSRDAHTGPSLPPSLALEPAREALARADARLAALGPPPYFGLTWRAGTAPEKQAADTWVLHKSAPVAQLYAVFSGLPGTLLALQRQPLAGEIAELARALGRPLHDFSDLNEDLVSMTALLARIDDYIGVSNTNMHLRAAVHTTARVLVPAPAEWRWMQSGAVSPWFPGFRLYRQSLHGEWGGATSALRRDLEAIYGATS